MPPSIADKKNNNLPMWGNEKTMNLNSLILTNIQSSHYFKVNLYQLKTYHEVIDEIYYQVTHLEPWEKGSRKTSGQTGMCGGVRGVGAGGIVSTAFCILYKLFTLKLTRKQLVGLINHNDSPYIRALGFMYIRYTQPPSDLWAWYETYLEDDEEVDVKAGTGQVMTVGEMLRHFLSKLEWFSTLFPRIPVPIQKDLESKLTEWRQRTNNVVPVSNLSSNNDAQHSYAEENQEESRSRTGSSDNYRDSKTYNNFDEELHKEKSRHEDRHKSTSKTYSSGRKDRHRSRSRSPYGEKKHKDRSRDEKRSSKHRSHDSRHRESKDDYRKSSKDRRPKDSHSHSRSRNYY